MTGEAEEQGRGNADVGCDAASAFRPLTDEERALIEERGLDPETACIAGGLVLDLSC